VQPASIDVELSHATFHGPIRARMRALQPTSCSKPSPRHGRAVTWKPQRLLDGPFPPHRGIRRGSGSGRRVCKAPAPRAPDADARCELTTSQQPRGLKLLKWSRRPLTRRFRRQLKDRPRGPHHGRSRVRVLRAGVACACQGERAQGLGLEAGQPDKGLLLP
jgi:hypothetical protein